MSLDEKKEYNYTIKVIDKKLEEDLIRNSKHIRKLILILIFVLLVVFKAHIMYWLKFGFAFYSKVDNTPISVMEEPVQDVYTNEESAKKIFWYRTLISGNNVTIKPVAYYKIAGLIVSASGIFSSETELSDGAALYDVAISWGKLGNKNFYTKYFECTKLKDEQTGGNVLLTTAKVKTLPVTPEYAMSHWSNIHIVPANNNIMGALIRIKTWDKIILEGMLVDMEYVDAQGHRYSYYTNTVRNENDADDDRNGNYQIMFVTRVRLGDKVYK